MKLALMLINILITATFVGCGMPSNDTVDAKDVDENKVFGRYSVNFNENTGVLIYFAQLRLGGPSGTTLRLTAPSNLQIDGILMSEMGGGNSPLNIIGTYYYLNENVETPKSSYTFKWTRNDGIKVQNTLPLGGIKVESPLEKEVFFYGKNLTIEYKLSGYDSNSNEEVLCELEATEDPYNRDLGKVKKLEKVVKTGNKCVFMANELKDLVTGHIKLNVKRIYKMIHPVGHDYSGGLLTSTYQSQTINIYYLH